MKLPTAKLFILGAAGVLAFSFLPAHAVGLAIQPARLTVTAAWGGEGTGAVLVANVSSEPAMYTVQTQARSAQLDVAPASFRLSPGESQLVSLRYRPRGWPARSGMLAVVARPLAVNGLPLGSGVRYPIQLVALLPWFAILSRGGLLGAVLAVAGWAIYRRRMLMLAGLLPPTRLSSE